MNVSPLDKNIQAYFNKVDNQFTERKIHQETHDKVWVDMFSIENKPHELIYQFPPEKLEDGVAAMWKRMGIYDQKSKIEIKETKGIIIDKKI